MEKIKSELEKLKTALQAAGSSIYQAAAEAAGQQQAGAQEEPKEEKKGDEKVVDADFKVEDEDKEKK